MYPLKLPGGLCGSWTHDLLVLRLATASVQSQAWRYIHLAICTPEVIFIYLKTEEVVNFWEVQIGGYVPEVLYSIESMCYSVWNTSVGLVLARTECLDLDLSFCCAWTWPVCLHPLVYMTFP